MNAEEYALQAKLSMRAYDDSRPRSRQTADFRLGVSDIGSCPNYAVLLTKQEPFSDAPSRHAAMMGTFIHDGIERAMKYADPDLIVGPEVTMTLENGVTLTGHPDRIDVVENSVTDDKTVDGTALAKREGPSDQQKFQVSLYALGAVQMGLLTTDRPLITRIVWWDRSGKDEDPVVWQQEWTADNVKPAVEWLDSVIYAVANEEDGERAKPVDWCASACPYYSKCRLPMLPEVDELITDPEIRKAAVAYKAGLEQEKEGASLKRASKAMLDGMSGIIPVDAEHRLRLRWISVAEVEVKAGTRGAHKRLDLREV
jgi:hypothetical protein